MGWGGVPNLLSHPLGSAQATKLISNSLMTAITGLVFDAFDLGAALAPDRLGEVRTDGSAANPSVGPSRPIELCGFRPIASR